MAMIQEVFSHTDTDGTVRHFSVPMLRASIRTRPNDWRLQTVPINRAFAAEIRRCSSVEEARLKAYPLSKLDEPGIACIFPDTAVLVVDGSHRIVKRVARGLKEMRFWMAEEAVWRECVVDGRDLIHLR